MSKLFNLPLNEDGGVYMIVNKNNKRKYIGSTLNLKKRAMNHKRHIENGNHSNPEIQMDILNGHDFIFNVLYQISEDKCTNSSELKTWTQLKEYETINKFINMGENLYNRETVAVILGRLKAEKINMDKIISRKNELEKLLCLPNRDILLLYKNSIYDSKERELFEKEILKRMAQ